MGVGQNTATRGPQVLVCGSIYQVSILGTIFDPQLNHPNTFRHVERTLLRLV